MRRKGKSGTALAKESIQASLRAFVIKRDGGCVLRDNFIAGACSGYTQDEELILQAEHLNGRANSISYAEPDNCVCLCVYHHIFFKKQNPALYWVLIRKVIGEKRWNKVEGWITDKSPHKFYAQDWTNKAIELAKRAKV